MIKITTRYKQLITAVFVIITCVLLGSFAASSAQSLGSSNPAIQVVKMADPTLIQSGGTVVYTYGITNTGDVSLTNVVLSDDKLGPIDLRPPRVTIGLQVLYTFEEGSGTTVHDVSGVEPALDLTVGNEAAAEWISGGGLSINSSTIVASAGTATKIIDACKSSDEISIEAWIKPANTTQGPHSPARIVTLSGGASVRDFMLGQKGSTYDVRLRTTATDENGIPSLTAGTVTTELSHVVYTRDTSGVARLYVNGVEAGSRDDITGDFSNWESFRFGLANEFGDDERPWLGEYHLVAIYDQALSQDEVVQNFEAKVGPTLSPGESITASASSDPLYVDTTNTAIVTGTVSAGVTVSDTDTATVTVIICEPGSFEPDDTIDRASKIIVHTPQCHRFEERYDEDWVKFWAWADVEYTIETFGLSVFNDTELWLYDAEVNELEHNADYGGTPASRIDWTAPASGTYFVKVAHEKGWGGDGYFYFLQVIESYPDSDIYEPDNTMDEATPITVGTEQAHTFHGACGGDVDWVKFDATTGTAYIIQTFGLSGDNDTVLRLYDAGKNEVASDDDDLDYPPASRIDWTATNDGTYFVEVVHFNRFAGGGGDLSYSLKVVTTADPPAPAPPPGVCADAFEPDDAWHNAKPIEVNGGLQERNFDVPGDEDWVKFWAFVGNEYTIRTSDLPEGNDTELYLYNADRLQLDYNDDEYLGSGHSLITRTVSETGAYFVMVKHPKSEGGCDFTYSLEVTSTVPCVDIYEEDDTPQDAKPITVDDDLPQSHNFHVPCICGGERAADEADWVWFQAEEGVVYTIKTTGLGGGNDTLLELYSVGIVYDPTLKPEAVSDDYDADDLLPSRIAWKAPEGKGGKYYVKVLPFDDRHGGCGVSYDLEVNTDELTVIVVGKGSVTKDPDKETYDYDEEVSLDAEAALGWTFDQWSGDLDPDTVATNNPITITMDRGRIVTATFTHDEYTLTIDVEPVGSGSVTKDPDQATYHYSDTVTLTATPYSGYTFINWTGALSGSKNPETIHITGHTYIDAHFERLVYHVYLPIILKPCACQDTHEPDQYEDYMNWPALESGVPFESYICREHIHLEEVEVEGEMVMVEVERDWYWFKIDELYDIEVDLDVPDTVNYDLFLWVGHWVRAEDPGRGVDEHIDWSAEGIGYYVVVVKSIGDADNCTPYKLTVTLKPQ